MTQKNDILHDIKIDTLSYGGDGISKEEGRQHIFVPFSAPGDVLDVKVRKVQKNMFEADIEKIKTKSPLRIKAECEYFTKCGGCHYQHIGNDTELNFKQNHVSESLQKFTRNETPNVEAIKTDAEFGYRNKIVLHVDKGQRIGFLDQEQNFLEVKKCLIADERINALIDLCAKVLKDNPFEALMYITFRASKGALGLILSFDEQYKTDGCYAWFKKHFTLGANVSLYFSHINRKKHYSPFSKNLVHMSGPEKLIEKVLDLDVKVWPFSFWQNNTEMAQQIAQEVVTWAKDNSIEKCIDLYSGSGFFSLALAQHEIYSLGIELNADAVLSAKDNSIELQLSKHCFFVAADAQKGLQTVVDNAEDFQAMVIDPPRKGLDKKAFVSIDALALKHIAYVSCNPATFARDAQRLSELGFSLVKTTPFNMFPQTYHVELVGFFEKISDDDDWD